MNGVGSLPGDGVQCDFEDQSFDLKIKALNKKNWRLRIAPLDGFISPAECKINVKANGISITLSKAHQGKDWKDLAKSTKTKDAAEKKGKADAGNDLMAMMKNMYNEGDDKTKLMIAQSWEKAQKGEIDGGIGGVKNIADLRK